MLMTRLAISARPYLKDFTFVCPTEIIAFSDRVKEFEKLGRGLRSSTFQLHLSRFCH